MSKNIGQGGRERVTHQYPFIQDLHIGSVGKALQLHREWKLNTERHRYQPVRA
jgi:prophage DNA circulation protein